MPLKSGEAAFSFEATHIKRYLVSCSDVDAGAFSTHAATISPFPTAHRKFACSRFRAPISTAATCGYRSSEAERTGRPSAGRW